MKRTSIFICLLFTCSLVYGANDSTGAAGATPKPRRGEWLNPLRSDLSPPYWLGYLTDTRDLFTGFTRWHAGEWVTASVAVGAVAGLFAVDDKIRPVFQRNRTLEGDKTASVFKLLGDGTYAVPSLGGAYVYGWIFNDERARDAARFGVESFVLAGAVTSVLKYGLHRHRPWDNQGTYLFDGPSLAGDDESFPSGHATTAFSIAGAIAGVYHDNIFVPIVAYTLAAGVGLARMNDDAHWASDVVAGAIIGTVAAHTVVSSERKEHTRRVSVAAAAINGHPGLTLNITY